MMANSAENYLQDLVNEILAMARQAKETASNDPFEKGKCFAYYEILSLMKGQAIAFGIEVPGLKDLNPEEFLS